MECQRFQKLIKAWYLQVQGEAMAPARMVAFMDKHLAECPVCLADSLVQEEVKRIATFVLPEVKPRKPSEDDDELADDEPVDGDPAEDSDELGDGDAADEDEEEEDELDEDDDI